MFPGTSDAVTHPRVSVYPLPYSYKQLRKVIHSDKVTETREEGSLTRVPGFTG
jgi:hypothetical protein